MTCHLLNMSCARDEPLSHMMVESARRFPCVGEIVMSVELDEQMFMHRLDTRMWQIWRAPGFGQWGWPSTRIKFECISRCAALMRDGQYLVCVDSDVFFANDEIFKAVRDKRPPIAGNQHSQTMSTRFGDFAHYSGACIFLRSDVVEYLASFGPHEFEQLESELRKDVDCVQEDVAISWAVKRGPFGAGMNISEYWEGDIGIDEMLAGQKPTRSVMHMNVGGKEMYPARLKEKGVYPPW